MKAVFHVIVIISMCLAFPNATRMDNGTMKMDNSTLKVDNSTLKMDNCTKPDLQSKHIHCALPEDCPCDFVCAEIFCMWKPHSSPRPC